MFEYTLENGKSKLVAGLICLAISAVAAILMQLLLLIDNPTVQMAITILFAIIIGATAILGVIFTIFGAIVYHAERTATRPVKLIEKETISFDSQLKKIDDIYKKKK